MTDENNAAKCDSDENNVVDRKQAGRRRELVMSLLSPADRLPCLNTGSSVCHSGYSCAHLNERNGCTDFDASKFLTITKL